MNETRTTCPYCGVGCGVVARVEGDKVTVQMSPYDVTRGRITWRSK